MPEITKLQFRRGTAAQWTAADPVLSAGTPGYESDTGKLKVGDGVKTWSALPYAIDPAAGGGTAFDINTLPAKTTPVDADVTPFADSADTFKPKKLTWANLKAAVGTWYDTAARTMSNKTLVTPKVQVIRDSGNGFRVVQFNAGVTNDAAYLYCYAAPTRPTVTALGAAADIDLYLYPKGNGYVEIARPKFAAVYDPAGNQVFQFGSTGTPTANLYMYANGTTGTPVVTVSGTAADIDLALLTKGTGKLLYNSKEVATVDQLGVTGNWIDAIPNATGGKVAEKAGLILDGWGGVAPDLINDLAFVRRRGATITVLKNGTPAVAGVDFPEAHLDALFAVKSLGQYSLFSNDPLVAGDTIVIEVGNVPPGLLRWGTTFGVQQSYGLHGSNLHVEAFWGGSWNTVLQTAGAGSLEWKWYNANGGTDITGLRYTFSGLAGKNLKVPALFAINADGRGLGAAFLPRVGGELYGTTATPPTLAAAGGDTNIGLAVTTKGTGKLTWNGNEVLTTASPNIGGGGGGGGMPSVPTVDLPGSVITMPREYATRGAAHWDGVADSTIMLTYLYPQQDRTITHLTCFTRDAGTGTPTLGKVAIYHDAGRDGNLQLVGGTDNAPFMATSGWSAHDRPITSVAGGNPGSNVTLLAGERYAIAVLMVGTATMPQFQGCSGIPSEWAATPRVTGRVDGQTDLPAAINKTSIDQLSVALYLKAY